jgi:lipid II:glycine glycyltransferase (peptidoglycan interpeptide bridge formation enzyme)
MRKFTTVARRLRDACSVWVAWHEGVPIASVITLVHGDHSYYWRGFSERDAAARTRVNDLLQSLIIEDSCAAGRRYYNMGESGGVTSLMDFKKKFGAQPTHTQEFRYERFPFSRLARWEATARHSGAQLLATRTAQRLRPGEPSRA